MKRPDERDYAFGRSGSAYTNDLEKWADWAEDRIAVLEAVAEAISDLKGCPICGWPGSHFAGSECVIARLSEHTAKREADDEAE